MAAIPNEIKVNTLESNDVVSEGCIERVTVTLPKGTYTIKCNKKIVIDGDFVLVGNMIEPTFIKE